MQKNKAILSGGILSGPAFIMAICICFGPAEYWDNQKSPSNGRAAHIFSKTSHTILHQEVHTVMRGKTIAVLLGILLLSFCLWGCSQEQAEDKGELIWGKPAQIEMYI